jgi:hypothetical protein
VARIDEDESLSNESDLCHTLLCEILSSVLGVKCCASLVVSALLMTPISEASLDRFLYNLYRDLENPDM